ncbi:putative E3 ubiquitin-protein ligase ARI5 [Silene latifolia]|uniref:putative E3 ubiquitin-protein ligase ARI5 n=1 Tax=Silene latifolia TaxID=37657 RepID=UPI003D7821EF
MEEVQERPDGHLSVTNLSKRRYIVLNVSDIQHCQSEQISHVSSVLSVTKYEASVLLCHYKWNTSRFVDHWFHNEESVRNEIGLFVEKSKLSKHSDVINCGICFEENLSVDEVMSANCDKHYYCKSCWRNYVSTSINNNGSGCLSLRCPDPTCPAVVGHRIIRLVSKDDRRKYYDYFIRSYVDDRESVKWCPGQGCDRAIEFEHSGGTGGYDVECDCSHCFCWNCGEEAHRPVECKVVAKWVAKIRSESKDLCTNWIRTCTKPCPKCRRPIEKADGCDHMTCSAPCWHRFCWLCLKDLSGQYFPCKGCKKTRKPNKENRTNFTSKCYEGWIKNNKLLQNAKRHLKKSQNTELPEPIITQLEFVVGFWKLIVECRQVLKWSFVYGSVVLNHDHGKRQLLENLQYQLEVGLEQHYWIPQNGLRQDLLKGDESEVELIKFREKITRYTKNNAELLERLVKALEPQPLPSCNTNTFLLGFPLQKLWFCKCFGG